MGYLDYAGLQYLWDKLKEKFAPKSHSHDDRYYTEAEVNSKLSGKADNTEAGANGLINKLESGTAAPVDDDLIITQWANHTTATAVNQNKYVRRPMSSIWSYIKGKADSVYQPKGSYAASGHSHDDRYYTESEMNTKLSKKAENIVLASDTNLNNITTPGFYSCGGGNKITNKPNNTDAIGLIVTHNASGNYYTQILTTSSNSNTYRRTCLNGSWSGWTQDKYTDTNTWRGIQNNLTSDSTSDSLSAAQGKALKGLVDGKANSSHTHTKSQISDFPASLKNPTALTIQTNGATAATYDGSAAKTVNITKGNIGLGNVDNTADANKSVKYATSAGSANTATKAITADSALAVENLSASVDVASSGKSADITLSSLTKAKAKLNVAVTGVATMGKKGTTDLTIDVPNQNDLLNALTNDDIDAITGGMVDDDGNPIKPNEVIVDASLTVSGRAADAKVTGDKIKEAKATADSASSGVKSVREELDQLKLDSVAVDKTLMKEGFAADAKTVGEKLNIKAAVVDPHTFTIPITG